MDFQKPTLSTGLLVFLATFFIAEVWAEELTLHINLTHPLHVTTRNYLGVTVSSGQLRMGLIGYDFQSQKLKNLAAALAPADVRVGGTYADFLTFDENYDDSTTVYPEDTNVDATLTTEEKRQEKIDAFNNGDFDFTLSGTRWNDMTDFFRGVGWDLQWDFNLLTPSPSSAGNQWDPTAAGKFLDYCAQNDIKIPNFELGNEPNLYDRKFGVDLDAVTLANDYHTLKDLISSKPQFKDSGIYAPGVNNLDVFSSPRKFLAEFLTQGGCDVTTEVAMHHYNFKAEDATSDMFVDVGVMDRLRSQLEIAHDIVSQSCGQPKPLRFTESSTASGGGKFGLSNAYIAGFLWLDRLGLSATYGVTRVYRQTFLKSSYALVTKRLKPNPDYFLSVLYKRLVEGPVFHVEATSASAKVRVYAHCVSQAYYSYDAGAIVLYYLNVGTVHTVLPLTQFGDAQLDLFKLTPGDSKGLRSRKVKLNGNLLKMRNDELPDLTPTSSSNPQVILEPQTFGFIVVKNAGVQECVHYHNQAN